MAENTGAVEEIFSAKQGDSNTNGPQDTEKGLDNRPMSATDDPQDPTNSNQDATAAMEVNDNAEVNANINATRTNGSGATESNDNIPMDSNANAPSRTVDSDKDVIEKDSLEDLEPLPEAQQDEGTSVDGSPVDGEKPVDKEPLEAQDSSEVQDIQVAQETPNQPQEIDIPPETTATESKQEETGHQSPGGQGQSEDPKDPLHDQVQEVSPGVVQNEGSGEVQEGSEENSPENVSGEEEKRNQVGKCDPQDTAQGFINNPTDTAQVATVEPVQELTLEDAALDQEVMGVMEGSTQDHFEVPFSPAYSESRTYDILVDTDRDFGSEVCRFSTIEPEPKHTPQLVSVPVPSSDKPDGTADATHDDLNTTATTDDQAPRQRKEPVLDASKLREREEREERNAHNRRAHLQKKSGVLKEKNEQRRVAVEERRRQQEAADKERKDAIMQRSRDREDVSRVTREKRRSWSAFGPRESSAPTPSSSIPRGRSSDRLTSSAKGRSSSNLTGSKQLSSSVSNIYHHSVKLVRLGPNDDDWFEMHVPEKSKKKGAGAGSPGGSVTPSGGLSGDARSPVGALRSSPGHHRSTPNLASFVLRDSKSSHSTPTHGPRPSAAAVTERLSRPKTSPKSPSTSTNNLSTPPASSTKRAPSPRTVGRPPSPKQRTQLSTRSSNASNASAESQNSGDSGTPRRPPSPRGTPRDKSSDSHSSGKTPSNKSTSSNPPPIKKALTPSAGVTKPTPTRPGQTRPKSSTPVAKKESPTAATPDKAKAPSPQPDKSKATPSEKPKAPAAAKSKVPPPEKSKAPAADKPKAPAADKPKTASADKPKAPQAERPRTPSSMTKAAAAPVASKPAEAKQNGSDSGDSKPEMTAEERAKAALAERRRLAREQKEREAELEKQRQEQLKREEEERKKKEEEERIRAAEEAARLAEEAQQQEEERLQREAEEEEKRAEEQRLQEEEDEKKRVEEEQKRAEEAQKKEEERAKQEAELAAKHQKELEERDARRKRVDEIMKRARQKTQNKDDQPGSPDSEKSSDSQGEISKSSGVTSASMMGNDKYRSLLAGSRGEGNSNPTSGDEESRSSEEAKDEEEEEGDSQVPAAIEESPATSQVEEQKAPPSAEDAVANDLELQEEAAPDASAESAGDDVGKSEQQEEAEKAAETAAEAEEPVVGSEDIGLVTPQDAEEKPAEIAPVDGEDKVEEQGDAKASELPLEDQTIETPEEPAPGDASLEQAAADEPSLPENTLDQEAQHLETNGPVPEASIPQNSDVDEKTIPTNNGEPTQQSSLVIDPKVDMNSEPLLIENQTASKTEIEITNGDGGLTMEHGNGDANVGSEVKVGLKLEFNGSGDKGIEGNNGQSEPTLASEI